MYFNGVSGVSVTYKQGENGAVQPYLGTGTYTLDSYCRGTASITLKQNGVVTDTISLSFMVTGTPTSPMISAMTSNPAGVNTIGVLAKINL